MIISLVKAPRQVEIRADLPPSKVGKVMKKDVRATLLDKERQAWVIVCSSQA